MQYTWNNTHRKILKSHTKIISQLPRGMKDLSYLMDHIHFEYITKKHETMTNDPPIRICVNKIEHRIMFRIKTGYYLKLLMPEAMKLLRHTEKQK